MNKRFIDRRSIDIYVRLLTVSRADKLSGSQHPVQVGTLPIVLVPRFRFEQPDVAQLVDRSPGTDVRDPRSPGHLGMGHGRRSFFVATVGDDGQYDGGALANFLDDTQIDLEMCLVSHWSAPFRELLGS